MERKQTAVERLMEELTTHDGKKCSVRKCADLEEHFKKALEAEREQIVESWQLASPHSTRAEGEEYYWSTYRPTHHTKYTDTAHGT